MRPLLLLLLLALSCSLLSCHSSRRAPKRPDDALSALPAPAGSLPAPGWLRVVPADLTPRQWRRAVRVAGKAAARVEAAEHPAPAAPLVQIASGNVKQKTRTVNKQGQRAAGGVAIGAGASAPGAIRPRGGPPWWLWLVLLAVIGWLVRRWRPG